MDTTLTVFIIGKDTWPQAMHHPAAHPTYASGLLLRQRTDIPTLLIQISHGVEKACLLLLEACWQELPQYFQDSLPSDAQK